MQGLNEPRDWMLYSEALRQVQSEGIVITYQEFVRAAKTAGVPVRRYGFYQYETKHLDAVRAYARREGLVLQGGQHG